MSIHPTAVVMSGAVIGARVDIGAFSIIESNVVIGDDVSIGSHCVIGHQAAGKHFEPLEIGSGSTIRSHSIVYEGSVFGAGLVTGHHVTLREGIRAGEGFQIGTLGDVQGNCVLGDFVKCHSNVHIGQGSTVGNYVWIFPYTVLTNDPHPPSEVRLGVTLDDFVSIATMSVILPGVRVGRGALVGAHSSVSRDVDEDTVVAGVPAKFICETKDIKLKDGSGEPAYPWRRHFTRGYPSDIVEQWTAEFNN